MLACKPSRPCLMRGCPPPPYPPTLLLLLLLLLAPLHLHPPLLYPPSQLLLLLLLLLLPNHLTATANHSHSHSNSLPLLLLLLLHLPRCQLLLVWEPCTLPHPRQSPPAPTLVLHAAAAPPCRLLLPQALAGSTLGAWLTLRTRQPPRPP